MQSCRLIASNVNKWTPLQVLFNDFTDILKMLFQAPLLPPCIDSNPPIKFGRPPTPSPPLLPHMISTENLGQTSMWVTTNFQRGKIQRKRKIIFAFFHCYFLWLTHFLNLLSFLHELTIWTSAQEFCQILNIREILPSSRENLFLLNTEDSSSVNLNSINEFTKLKMSV